MAPFFFRWVFSEVVALHARGGSFHLPGNSNIGCNTPLPYLFVCFTAVFLVAIFEELLHLQRMESLVHLRDMEVENCIALILHQSTILVEAIAAGQQLCNLLNI
jgi:hypothetical protein